MGDIQAIQRGIQNTLAVVTKIEVPYAWLRALGNHSAVLLLAEILAAYAGSGGSHTRRWQGSELLLDYKELSSRLGISERSLTRASKLLIRRKLITYRREDRVVGGRTVRNVVGVVPRLAAIVKLSGVSPGGVVAANATRSEKQRQLTATLALSHWQESLLRAYDQIFEEFVGAPYVVTSAQQVADRRAAASLSIPPKRGAGHKYDVWAREWLEAMADQGVARHGSAVEAAFDRNSYVREPYSLESFVDWAKTDKPLPNGYARRFF